MSEHNDVIDKTVKPVMVEADVVHSSVHLPDWDTPEKLKLLIEGALFASQNPMSIQFIQALFPEQDRPTKTKIETALTALQDDYTSRAIDLCNSPLGYRFQVRPAATPLVKSMLTDKPPKYSRATLETLALIAYRQPVTRGEIEDVRGVSVSSHIMRSMEERGWIRVVGHKELPGRPALWATTPGFLAYFGLNSLGDLPALADISLIGEEESPAQESESVNTTPTPPSSSENSDYSDVFQRLRGAHNEATDVE